ncbi:MAG: acyl-CoA thioesterase [Actinomycetota bacterium]|nr:acyl-CoA thioesterase [Actinomycetota bacterium]
MTGEPFVHIETAKFRDLDPMGHVNNSVFLTYIESARIKFLQELGAATGIQDMSFVIARIEIDFRSPVRMDDEIEISVRASRFGGKSFDLDYELRVGGEVVAAAKSVCVSFDYETGEAMPIPEDWREKLSAVAA